MIERVSRYYDGPLAQTKDKYTSQYVISVFRAFPESKTVNYITHIWKEGDSLTRLSKEYGLGTRYWWEIMEINPEIMDPLAIPLGTSLRVPYGN